MTDGSWPSDDAYLYHALRLEDWRNPVSEQPQGGPPYRASSLDREGFIHLSTREQIQKSVQLYFRAQDPLLLLTIDPKRCEAPLKWEKSRDDLPFPHLYGPLNLDAIVKCHALGVDDSDGRTWPF